ncbi:Short chain alcohol dehydrogenase-like protein, partial [Daphnia magna]
PKDRHELVELEGPSRGHHRWGDEPGLRDCAAHAGFGRTRHPLGPRCRRHGPSRRTAAPRPVGCGGQHRAGGCGRPRLGGASHRSHHGAGRRRCAGQQRGITGPNVKVWDYPVDAWKQVFDVNVHGLFHCCRELSAHMKTRNYGRIINIASVAGKDGNPNASAYSASKAAVIGLTKSLGKELADTGVRVNCVTPAAVKTAIFDQMTPEHIQFMLSKIPMARFGEPEEVAAMVTWLSTEECSFSTGAVFDLSGGRSTY